MTLDTQALFELCNQTWRGQLGRGDHVGGFPTRDTARQDFVTHASQWWLSVFKLEHLSGITVPNAPLPPPNGQTRPGRMTTRRFDFGLSTDGVGCSFLCKRAKRETPAPWTPETVPISRGEFNFVAIDPGQDDIACGVRSSLRFSGFDELNHDGYAFLLVLVDTVFQCLHTFITNLCIFPLQ
jgi:hypothetical protein